MAPPGANLRSEVLDRLFQQHAYRLLKVKPTFAAAGHLTDEEDQPWTAWYRHASGHAFSITSQGSTRPARGSLAL